MRLAAGPGQQPREDGLPPATNGRPIQSATIAVALRELHAAGLAAVDAEGRDEPAGRCSAAPVERDPLLDAVDLHGAPDFRHTYATWLEDAGIPARVIDELMVPRPAAGPSGTGAAPWAPTTGTPARRWPPESSTPFSND